MVTQPAHIAQLVYQSLTTTINDSEQLTLDEWLQATPRHQQWYDAISGGEYSIIHPNRYDKNWQEALSRELWQQTQGKTGVVAGLEQIPSSATGHQRIVHRVHLLRTAWFRVAVAVILTVGLGVIGYNLITRDNNGQEIARNEQGNQQTNQHSDILPGSTKAVLTLSDGRRVELDSATSGTINDQQLSIENTNGQLVYSSKGIMAMNTMTTPNGGQYQLTLADGSRVWLNAASSITYPTAFIGKTREVQITGEAYFEVIKNAAAPFIVKTPTDVITVLGTAFNVHAYADEAAVKTSLINGSVNVNDTNIKPGQAYSQGKVTSTNTAQDIAWKNGAFDFANMDLKSAFRMIGRWYDVDVQFEGNTSTKELRGRMGRDLTLHEVLASLEQLGIYTRLEGRTLTILSQEK